MPNHEEWYAQYETVLKDHAAQIVQEAIAELNDDSPLLEVCEKGQTCRDDVDAWLNTTITQQWATVLTTLRTTIESTSHVIEEIIEDGYDAKV